MNHCFMSDLYLVDIVIIKTLNADCNSVHCMWNMFKLIIAFFLHFKCKNNRHFDIIHSEEKGINYSIITMKGLDLK